ELQGHPCLSDAQYLLALALTREMPRHPKEGGLPEPTGSDLPEWSLARWLAWVFPPDKRKTQAGPKLGELSVAQAFGNAPDEVLVGGVAPSTPVSALLERLARLVRMKLEWTGRARQLADGRTAVVAVENRPLMSIFQALADPLDLVWSKGKDGT